MDIYNLVSFTGIFVLVGFAWLISADRRRMNWHVVVWGIVLQLVFGYIVFSMPGGTHVFLFLNKAVIKVMDSASVGSRFLFGKLALPPGTVNEAGEGSLGFFLAFQGFPTIVFFSSLMSILYYCNILPLFIRGFAYVFTKVMRVSGAESLCAASNIFAGVESSLTIRPFLDRMTRSELCTILTAGMATVSSNVMALYVFSLKEYFPTIAGHLISASILSAPAALVMSKLILPETEHPETLGEHVTIPYERESNLFEAIINGAMAGVKLIVGIVALLLAVMGLVAMVDMVVTWFGGKINLLSGLTMKWALKDLLGYLFYPFTLLMGVPASDAMVISRIIGERMILTEVTSYQDLALALKDHLITHPRSAVIATYALCGFVHLASMAIFVGGNAAIAPGRTKDLSRVALRALIAATLACMMTACIAGTFFSNGTVLLGR